MEDLNKNAKTEKPIVVKSDLKKETAENAPKAPVKRIRVRTKPNPAPAVLTKSAPAPVAAEVISIPVVEPTKAAKQTSKKGNKTEEKIVVKVAPQKEKVETKPMVKKEPVLDLKEKPESVKVIKKKAKKAEEKVDKLKKKVKKAKKKDVKKSKLKSLKEKLGKALEKFKDKVEKLKEAKK